MVTAENEVVRGGIAVEKRDSITGSTPQGNADFSGIQFEIINDSKNPVIVGDKSIAPGEVALTLTTDSEGKASTAPNALPYGTYVLRESATNESMLNTAPNQLAEVTENRRVYPFFMDNEVVRGGVLIEKRDLESLLLTPLGMASLDGTLFEITNKSRNAVYVNGALYQPDEVCLTIEVKDGVAQSDVRALPYGSYTLAESKPGTGYLWTDKTIRPFEVLEDGSVKEYREGEAAYNQVKRGDLKFVKVGEDTMHRFANVAFKLTSQTTGESHILITDSNGEVRTETKWNPHTQDTNGNDDKPEAEWNDETGTWFGKTTEDWMVETQDGLCALPYDYYTLEELRCEGNKGYALVTVPNIFISRDSTVIELGTIDDIKEGTPEIGTTATVDGEKIAEPLSEVTIIDTVRYSGLTVGKTYKLSGVLMDKATGEPLTVDGKQVMAEKEFTPKAESGTVELSYIFNASALAGKSVVVFEDLFEGDTKVASHADIEDEGQTVTFTEPKIGTTATVNGEHTAEPVGEITIVDTVKYSGLIPGKEYTVKGVLMDKATGKPLMVNDKEITAEATFRASKAEGTIDIPFTFDASALAGKTVVVFETLYRDKLEVCTHADIEDKDQTVTFSEKPEIKTTATVNGEKKAEPVGEVTITDAVSYTGLTPGKTYKLSGVLMDKSTGGKLLVDGKEVTAEKEFTPENASGTEEIKFILDASALAGKSVVVFETLYFDSKEVASHTDINDEGQTVEFDGPEIKTKATVDGEKEVDPLETITLTDTVTYRNLIPGKTYQVKGVLMDKGTGNKLLVDGKEVTAENIFIPEQPTGTVEIPFTFPASALAGKTIVVFESVYHEGKEVAVHADLEDEDQTIIIRRKGGLLIRKTSEDDFVEGISFIVAGEGYEETFVTDKQGQIYVQDLVPGEYTVTEVEDDVTAKYIIEAGKAVTITPNDEPAEIEFHNKLKRGSVYIVKTAGGAPGENLSGAAFSVYADVDGNAEFDPETDTLFGKLEFSEDSYSLSGLPVGGYFLHEEKAPEGFTADDGYYYFKLTEDGERVEVTNTADKEAGFVNEKQTGSLRIVKVEKGTTTPLAGATFCVKDENGQVVAEGKTGKDGTTNTVTKPTPTAAPTAKVTPTPAPTATPKPTSTPKPTAVPSPTPIPDGQLVISCSCDKTGQAFSFEVSGTKAEGGRFSKDFKTGTDGKIGTEIPAGKYTVTPKSVKGFDLPQPQIVEMAAGGSAYLTFHFVANQRDLTLTVVDNDGQPVPGATVGLFEPGEAPLSEPKKETESGCTDINQTLAQIKDQKAADEKRADPYTKANALYVGKTGEDGTALVQNVPVAEFVAVPIELPNGYSSEKIATEIPAGLGNKFTIACKYVAVDLSVWSSGTDSPVVGADLVLLGKDNTELAKWTSEGTVHRLIRVPKGEYALKITQDGQSVEYVVKESRRAVEKALAGKSAPQQLGRWRQGSLSHVPQRVEQRSRPETPPPVHTPEYGANPPKSAGAQIRVEPPRQPTADSPDREAAGVYEDYTKPAPAISGHESSVEPPRFSLEEQPISLHSLTANPSPSAAPASAQMQGRNPQPKHTSQQNAPKNVPPAKAAPHPVSEELPHMRASDSRLRLSEEHSLNTWQKNSVTNGLQNQGAAIHTAEASGAALQTFQAAGQSAGSAGASAAANAAAPGVGAVIQATEKAVTKINETIKNIAASASQSSSSWGALAALFLMPLLITAAIAGAFRGGGSARNTNLSADVIALMPQISVACQTHGIPEYVPLVAAVMMQESGGRVADVGGDVMQCAEGMGLPVGTPVSVEESINFGTGIIANNLRLAGATGPTDIPAISLALQGYNFGSGYISWALARGGYTKENAREFSEWQAGLHGWSGYGDIDYVDHVLRYYQVSVGSMGDASAIAGGRFAYPLPGHTWDTYSGHNGIDISFANCYGEPVYAVAAGTIRYTQDGWTPAHGVGGMWSFGNSVFIEHGDGWISAYGHLSALAVASGETVTQGQLVGYIGSTGNSTGPHLHLALYHNGDAGIGGQNFAELAWPQYSGKVISQKYV